jgi:hypothetical protein
MEAKKTTLLAFVRKPTERLIVDSHHGGVDSNIVVGLVFF